MTSPQPMRLLSEPAEICTSMGDGSSRETWYSPPVGQGRYVYRFKAERRRSGHAISQGKLLTEKCTGWQGWVSKENWAEFLFGSGPAAQHAFEHHGKPPKGLLKKWGHDAIAFAYAGDPDLRDEMLEDLASDLGDSAARRQIRLNDKRAREARVGKLTHGTIALTSKIMDFGNHYGKHQLFAMLMAEYRGRNRLQPHIYNTTTGAWMTVTLPGIHRNTLRPATMCNLVKLRGLSNHQKRSLIVEADRLRDLLPGEQ